MAEVDTVQCVLGKAEGGRRVFTGFKLAWCSSVANIGPNSGGTHEHGLSCGCLSLHQLILAFDPADRQPIASHILETSLVPCESKWTACERT